MITSRIIGNGILRAIGVIVLIAIVLYFLVQIHSVLLYLLISFILTLILNPVRDFLKKRLKFNTNLATVATILFFIFIVGSFIMMFIPLILAQGHNLSLLNTYEIEKNSLQLIKQFTLFLDSHNLDSNKIMKEVDFTSKINFSFIPNFLNSLVGTIGNFAMGFGSVLFITFFFLKDRKVFVVIAKNFIPDHYETQVLNSIEKINILLSKYLIGLVLQLFIVFVLYVIVLLVFGIENAIIIAFLCAVLNIIPYIGPLIASVLAAILTMLSNLGNDFQSEVLPTTIFVLLGFWIVQLIDNNISQPLIFSKSVSSHPLEIFLTILIAGLLFGVFGMIIAVPLFTIIKVICKEFLPENKIIQLLTKNI